MYITTHLALGLIIGKVTGNYSASLLGSLIIDVDHLIPIIEKKLPLSIKKIWQENKKSEISAYNSRSYFHSIFSWLFFSVLISLINVRFGLIFSIAYLGHLVLDAIDDSEFYLFYPIKNLNIKGFIPYYSRRELIFSLFLLFFYIVY